MTTTCEYLATFDDGEQVYVTGRDRHWARRAAERFALALHADLIRLRYVRRVLA